MGHDDTYLYHNKMKKAEFDMLLLLIRELGISADSIFYSGKLVKDSHTEDLVRMLYNCDEQPMEIIKTTVKAAGESQPKE